MDGNVIDGAHAESWRGEKQASNCVWAGGSLVGLGNCCPRLRRRWCYRRRHQRHGVFVGSLDDFSAWSAIRGLGRRLPLSAPQDRLPASLPNRRLNCYLRLPSGYDDRPRQQRISAHYFVSTLPGSMLADHLSAFSPCRIASLGADRPFSSPAPPIV